MALGVTTDRRGAASAAVVATLAIVSGCSGEGAGAGSEADDAVASAAAVSGPLTKSCTTAPRELWSEDLEKALDGVPCRKVTRSDASERWQCLLGHGSTAAIARYRKVEFSDTHRRGYVVDRVDVTVHSDSKLAQPKNELVVYKGWDDPQPPYDFQSKTVLRRHLVSGGHYELPLKIAMAPLDGDDPMRLGFRTSFTMDGLRAAETSCEILFPLPSPYGPWGP